MTTNEQPPKRLVDQHELADILGTTAARVRDLHRRGRLPAYAIGTNRFRFDVDECLARLRVEANGGREGIPHSDL